MIITNATLQALRVKFSGDFAKGYQAASNWYDKVATTMPSSGVSNVYGWMAELPEMREWIGEREIANLKEHEYTLPNKRYELTYKVNRDAIADDNLGVYANHFTQLGTRTKKHPDIIMKDALQNGQNVATYDGQPFFSTAHLVDKFNPNMGTQQNYWSTGMALTPANYESVRAAMMGFKGESGTPLGVVPNLLIVPPQLEMAAKRILTTTMIPSAAGTSPETNVLAGTAEYVVARDLINEATTWYLLDTTRGIMPFIYQLRESSEFTMLTNPQDPNVFNYNEYKFGSTIRDAAGYSLWFLAAKAKA